MITHAVCKTCFSANPKLKLHNLSQPFSSKVVASLTFKESIQHQMSKRHWTELDGAKAGNLPKKRKLHHKTGTSAHDFSSDFDGASSSAELESPQTKSNKQSLSFVEDEDEQNLVRKVKGFSLEAKDGNADNVDLPATENKDATLSGAAKGDSGSGGLSSKRKVKKKRTGLSFTLQTNALILV